MIRVLILFLLFSSVCFAETRAIVPSERASENLFSVSAAFVSGVYDYAGGWPDLPGVREDLNAVEQRLKEEGFKVTRRDNLDKQSYKKHLDKFLWKYSNNKKARLLVYYAGHGHSMNDEGASRGYIVLRGASLPSKDMAGFKSGSLPMTYFASKGKDAYANYVMFVFDSCFSGSVFSVVRSVPEMLADVLGQPGRQFITSGTSNQMVPDVSVFRRRFIDGIGGAADENADGYITGSELGYFLRETVSEYSGNTQTPMYGKMTGYDGEFVFIHKSEQKPESPKPTGEREMLIAKLEENPHSPDAAKYLERLREIDESLSNMPPVEAPERKGLKLTASSKVIHKNAETYPYMIIAPVTVKTREKTFKAALRIRAADTSSYRKLNERRLMIRSVLERRLDMGDTQPADIIELRETIRTTAYEAVRWVCPGCISEKPLIAGLAGL